MTIEQVKAKKQQLEADIKDILHVFRLETGCNVQISAGTLDVFEDAEYARVPHTKKLLGIRLDFETTVTI